MIKDEQKKFIADYFHKKTGKAIPHTGIQDDGRIRRFKDYSKKEYNKNLFLCVYPFKARLHFVGFDYSDREGTQFSYRGEEEVELTSEEKRELNKQIRESIEQEQKKRREATEKAQGYFKSLPLLDYMNLPSPHPYLTRKGLVRSYIGRYDKDDDTIVVPLYGPEGEFKSYQKIHSTGKKGFVTGASTKGAFAMLYDKEKSTGERILVCEGLATGISVFEATEGRFIVVLAMSCGNLTEAIKSATSYFIARWRLKERPEEFAKRFLIIADNDKSGAGEEEAKKASKTTGCSYSVIPNLGNERIKDANDYAVYVGKDELQILLEEAGI